MSSWNWIGMFSLATVYTRSHLFFGGIYHKVENCPSVLTFIFKIKIPPVCFQFSIHFFYPFTYPASLPSIFLFSSKLKQLFYRSSTVSFSFLYVSDKQTTIINIKTLVFKNTFRNSLGESSFYYKLVSGASVELFVMVNDAKGADARAGICSADGFASFINICINTSIWNTGSWNSSSVVRQHIKIACEAFRSLNCLHAAKWWGRSELICSKQAWTCMVPEQWFQKESIENVTWVTRKIFRYPMVTIWNIFSTI